MCVCKIYIYEASVYAHIIYNIYNIYMSHLCVTYVCVWKEQMYYLLTL